MLLENIRRFFFGKTNKTWADTIKNVLQFGTQEKLNPNEEDEQSTASTIPVKHIVNYIQGADSSAKRNAQQVLQTLKEHDELDWNAKGELTMENSVLKNSNIHRIVKYLFVTLRVQQHKKKDNQLYDEKLIAHKPIGTDTFVTHVVKTNNLLEKAKNLELLRNREGGISLMKMGKNILNMSILIATIFSYLNLPWSVWLAALMHLDVIKFQHITNLLGKVPTYVTRGTFAQPVGEILQDFIEKSGETLDNIISSPTTKAAVLSGMSYGYTNFSNLYQYIASALTLLVSVVTLKRQVTRYPRLQ